MGYTCKQTLIILVCSLSSVNVLGSDVESCRALTQQDERLACYDSLFPPLENNQAASALSESSEVDLPRIAAETTELVNDASATAEPASVVVVAEMPSDVDASVVVEAEARAQEAYEQVISDAQSLTIASVQRTRRGTVYFRTVEGRTFKKDTSRNVVFNEGDVVTIERGVFSSMFLNSQDGKRIKVREID